MRKYGAPYKGSKSDIAERLLGAMPMADTFVDLFAGGCAMTHCAMVSGRFRHFIANDIDGGGIELFLRAVNGEYKDRTEWVSRDMFFLLKEGDPFIKYIWSFGNNGRNYLYGEDIEPYKKAIHEMLTAPTLNQRRLEWKKATKAFETTDRGDSEPLERLQSLEYLQALQNLQALQKDYQAVDIPPDSVIYCDIPYEGTDGYDSGENRQNFDYERFYAWAKKQTNIYISSYELPSDRFKCVYETKKTVSMAATTTTIKMERLFVPRREK